MSGKINKNWKSVVCAGMVILFLAGCAKANLVDSNTIVQDGIKYYIQADKAVYNLGEDVEILYRITNLTENRVDFGRHPLSFPCLFVITDDDNKHVWQWPWQIPLLPLVNVHLEPHESKEHEITWDMINDNGTGDENDDFPVGPGIYAVAGELMVGEPVPVSVDIEIIPEPCSLVLLGAGLLSVILYRKERTKR